VISDGSNQLSWNASDTNRASSVVNVFVCIFYFFSRYYVIISKYVCCRVLLHDFLLLVSHCSISFDVSFYYGILLASWWSTLQVSSTNIKEWQIYVYVWHFLQVLRKLILNLLLLSFQVLRSMTSGVLQSFYLLINFLSSSRQKVRITCELKQRLKYRVLANNTLPARGKHFEHSLWYPLTAGIN